MTDVVSPRVYEYLATGKPIVSMLWPGQVERFPDVIYNARDEGEFLTLCAHALEEDPGFVAGRRRDHAAQAAWPPAGGPDQPHPHHRRPALRQGRQFPFPWPGPSCSTLRKSAPLLQIPPFSDKMEPY